VHALPQIGNHLLQLLFTLHTETGFVLPFAGQKFFQLKNKMQSSQLVSGEATLVV